VDLQLENKIVFVTGGAKGIGAAIVRTSAAEAAIPVIVDRDPEASKKLDAEVRTSHVIIADLSSSANCQKAVDSTVEKFGRLDALVNNAGINDKIGLEHGTAKQHVESLGRNLLHDFNMAHFALPHLKKTGTLGYASSKGAILALTREWAAELLGYGIRVNAVIPAEVMTRSTGSGSIHSPIPNRSVSLSCPRSLWRKE